MLLVAGLAHAQVMPSVASASATSTAATASVSRAQFTTAINHREPADDITTLDNSHTQVFFFSVLQDATGQTITHRWQYNGQTMAQVKFEPKANRWRVWSSKKLLPSQTGTWTVEVLDARGNVLAKKSFNYIQATPAPGAATHPNHLP